MENRSYQIDFIILHWS